MIDVTNYSTFPINFYYYNNTNIIIYLLDNSVDL